MFLTGRRLLLIGSIVVAVIGLALWLTESAGRQVAAGILMAGFVGVIIAGLLPAPRPATRRESEDVRELNEARRRELMRGTSLYLREMRYRYSVRLDTTDSAGHRAFSAEVNTIRLGFVPAIITDNTNDRQGFGYVAFVHDGTRWRGPGLPCPADQSEAVQHAARCVSPLATEEETHVEG
jgi:hypothetical protein